MPVVLAHHQLRRTLRQQRKVADHRPPRRVPLVRQMEGFQSYYLLEGGPDVLITISIFDSSDAAFASNETAANWVRHNVLEFTRGMPEVMVGDALVAEVK
jgi:hypothetical protein